jgi:hypothetical protein
MTENTDGMPAVAKVNPWPEVLQLEAQPMPEAMI